MCDPVSATIATTAAVGYFTARSASRRQEAIQHDAEVKQDKAQAEAQDSANRIGPASKSIDLTQESQAITQDKQRRLALQNGIMGTVKTSSLSPTPAAAVAKTTLGS